MAGGTRVIDFELLVDNCWQILMGEARTLYPGSGKSSPARKVYVDPGNLTEGWSWDLWEEVIGPLLEDLWNHVIPPDGWKRSRSLVESHVRAVLMGSRWEPRVRWSA